MEPETKPALPEIPSAASATPTPEIVAPAPQSLAFRWVNNAFVGSQGLRAGWSAAIFAILFVLFSSIVALIFVSFHLVDLTKHSDLTAISAFFSELIDFLALVGTAALMAFIERRGSLLSFNLTGPRRLPHFLGGLVAGFAALSALVGAMAWGGWLHFGPIALSGGQIFQFGAMWAVVFLLVGCVEEGIFRCYLQSTLTRGINFWWALGIVGSVCLGLALKDKGNGAMGVYIVALLGLLPCLILHIRKTPRSGFWQAAWVTSTLFGSIHTGNGGENWIGIFAAALIGFVFCVSVWVTGSAWWAIGCHAAWDWAETFFYGTADSGLQPQGHYLASTPAGNALWSGGTNGPEGSLLVIGAILLLLALLLVVYGRTKNLQLCQSRSQPEDNPV